jgi:Domain of unknown function DUF29
MSGLYETDTLLWSEQQAEALRAAARSGANPPIDWEHGAEEIEALAKSERATLASHVNTVIEHLARLEASPAVNPRNGWIEIVLRTRNHIEDVLRSSPSLRQTLDTVFAGEHPRALRLVGRVLVVYGETPRVPLDSIHFSLDQVLVPWLPGDGPGEAAE